MDNNYDIIICGAGPSGVMAAIAASRQGAKVLLIEAGGYPGGSLTNALVYPMMTFHAGKKQVVAGIADEMIKRLIAMEASPGHIPDPLGCVATITPADPRKLVEVMTEMLHEAKVTVNYGMSPDSIMFEDGYLTYILMGNKELSAKVYIDATGNGDLAASCGVPFTIGRDNDNLTQPMTLMFTMENVNINQLRDEITTNSDNFVLADDYLKNPDKYPYLALSGFFKEVELVRKDLNTIKFRDRVLLFQLPGENRVAINMTRINGFSALSNSDLSKARIAGMKQIKELEEFLRDYIPGFADAEIELLADNVGIRESRHFKCKSILTAADIQKGKKHKTGIACGSFPIDIHSPDSDKLTIYKQEEGSYYNIPYECMISKEARNLLITGRAIGATHEASASARLSPTCMALGEAAGIAAAMSVKYGCSTSRVDIKKLRTILQDNGAVIE